jgi:hypothetical protein
MLKKRWLCFPVVILVVGFAALIEHRASASVDDNEAFIGAWQGSWTGEGSGKFEMTIKRGPAAKLSGSISTKPDDGDPNTVEFKTIEVTSGKLRAEFENADGDVKITITGSLDGKSLKGTYTARQTDGTQVDAGSWEATRK